MVGLPGSSSPLTAFPIEAIGDEDDRLSRVDEQATLYPAARHLPRRECQILFLRFGQDLTQTEIAARIGVSQMQVSRLLRHSLHRLRELTDDRTASTAR